MDPLMCETIAQALRERHRKRRNDKGWRRDYAWSYDQAPDNFPWGADLKELPQLTLHQDWQIARTALEFLSLLGRSAFIPFLEARLTDASQPDPQAGECLARFPRQQGLRILLHQLKTHPESKVRSNTASGLRRIQPWPSASLPTLTKALLDRIDDPKEHPFVREACLESLGFILGRPNRWSRSLNQQTQKRLLRSVMSSLKDPSAPVRFFACYAAGTMGFKACIPILQGMRKDPAYYPHL